MRVLAAILLAVCVASAHSDSNTSIAGLEENLAAQQVMAAWTYESGDQDFEALGDTSVFEQKSGADALFEIGSISKVFTNLLLAELVAKGQTDLETTIASLLPEVTFENSGVGAITLKELATHTSGLARLPGNLNPSDRKDPYADYRAEDLLADLATTRASQTLVKEYSYSNYGLGLLGYLLGRIDGDGYSSALDKHVLKPMNLDHTFVQMTGDQFDQNTITAYRNDEQMANWHFDALAGAGAIVSNTQDLGKFAMFFLGNDWPLQQSRDVALAPTDGQTNAIWHLAQQEGHKVYWHNGGTGGFRSFLGIDPQQDRAIILLTNSGVDVTPAGLAWFAASTIQDAAQALPNDASDYLGYFAINDGFVLHVFIEQDQLLVQATNQPAFALAQADKDKFAVQGVDAQLEFVRDEQGQVSEAILVQAGQRMSASRTDGPAKPKYTKIDVPAEELAQYVGQYQLAPGAVFDIQLQDEQLTAQLSGQPAFPIYAFDEDKFFYEVVDAQLSFVEDSGTIVAVILHQGGMDQRAVKIE